MNKKLKREFEVFQKIVTPYWKKFGVLITGNSKLLTLLIGGAIALVVGKAVLDWLIGTPMPLPRYGEDMTVARIGTVIASGVIGFILGWLFSPKAKLFRKIAAFVVCAIPRAAIFITNFSRVCFQILPGYKPGGAVCVRGLMGIDFCMWGGNNPKLFVMLFWPGMRLKSRDGYA